jgi:molybdopterin-containing oxidoreductase family iron-sulfur binding subunit
MNESYWRSLGELEDSPSFRANLEREFPEGASELPEGVTRREMLMLLGASLSLAGLASCRRDRWRSFSPGHERCCAPARRLLCS